MDPRMAPHPTEKVSSITPRSPLTDRHLRALRPGPAALEEWDTQQRGLMVRVLPERAYRVRYSVSDSRQAPAPEAWGVYPAVGLALARKRARKAQSAIDNGEDPARDRRTTEGGAHEHCRVTGCSSSEEARAQVQAVCG